VYSQLFSLSTIGPRKRTRQGSEKEKDFMHLNNFDCILTTREFRRRSISQRLPGPTLNVNVECYPTPVPATLPTSRTVSFSRIHGQRLGISGCIQEPNLSFHDPLGHKTASNVVRILSYFHRSVLSLQFHLRGPQLADICVRLPHEVRSWRGGYVQRNLSVNPPFSFENDPSTRFSSFVGSLSYTPQVEQA
jgi:hypothetical protein